MYVLLLDILQKIWRKKTIELIKFLEVCKVKEKAGVYGSILNARKMLIHFGFI